MLACFSPRIADAALRIELAFSIPAVQDQGIHDLILELGDSALLGEDTELECVEPDGVLVISNETTRV